MEDTTVSTDAAPIAPPTSPPPAGKAAPKGASVSTGKNAHKPDDDDKAVVSCMRAWNYAYKKEAANLGEGESDYPAEKAANQAYLRETPPLSGHENICDFIACINFASMTGIVTHREAAHYLANARIALAALSLQPKPQATGAKSGGKPAANPAEGTGE
jgi:hypothetical protein